MRFKRDESSEGYLSGLLSGSVRPFRYRSGACRLLGMPGVADGKVVFAAPLPPGSFAYGPGYSVHSAPGQDASSMSPHSAPRPRGHDESSLRSEAGRPAKVLPEADRLSEVPREEYELPVSDSEVYPPPMPAQGPRHAPIRTGQEEERARGEQHERPSESLGEIEVPGVTPPGQRVSVRPVQGALPQAEQAPSLASEEGQNAQPPGFSARRKGAAIEEEAPSPRPVSRPAGITAPSEEHRAFPAANMMQQQAPEGRGQQPISFPDGSVAPGAPSPGYGAPVGTEAQLDRLRRTARGSIPETPVPKTRPVSSAEVRKAPDAANQAAPPQPVVLVQPAPAPPRPVPKAFWQTSVLRSMHLRSIR